MWKSKGIRLVLVSLVIVTMLLAGGCNKAPTITSLTPGSTTLAPGESCSINCVASDPDGDTLTYAWSVSGGAISGTGNNVSWTAPTTLGSYTITVTVSDGEDSVSESCTVQVVNTPPVISSLNPSSTDVAPSASCTISCAASDADGDNLTYAWSASGGTITGTGESVSWEAPAAEGTYTISVEVSDGVATDSASCDITVEMKYGSIDIQSDPAGAEVYLDGVDTGNITPYVITNLAPGTYTVMLEYYHYKYREETVTVTANETTYINWSLTYAPEQTLTIQPDDTEGEDASVYLTAPTTNDGESWLIVAGGDETYTYRLYLQFSIDAIPEDVVITSARLGLSYAYNAYNEEVLIGAYTVLGAWDEAAITWDNQPTFGTTLEGSYTFPTGMPTDYRYFYITDMVIGWYDGTIINYGVVLKAPDEPAEDGWVGFCSSEFDDSSVRPKLVITYFDPTP